MEGQAVSLVNAEEVKLLRAIERLINRDIEVVEIEGYTGHNETVQDIEKRRADAESKRPPRNRNSNRSGNSGRRQNSAGGNASSNRNRATNNKGNPGNSRRAGGGGRNR